MVVLGIDPGTANTGYGVVLARAGRLAALDGGVIATGPESRLEQRLARIHARVRDLIATHRPAALAVEDIYFGQNVRTAFAVGQARGAVLLAGALAGLDCAEYAPARVKQTVCGYGRADKDQVQRMVRALLALERPPTPNHAADALAVAICHALAPPLARMVKVS